ncbi:hypothetical protein [Kitasatospora viridis]|uniref:Uncharacterized protein n=1 Tax=Kitasatospora viridis TaxID=281105 RepID=A0A561S9Z2_9ACTN|nr:hypothetical protein [Kitasatospora viridis]TWF71691.1 hypothetical protein FHX73_1862 [Kitasatospora viridis]
MTPTTLPPQGTCASCGRKANLTKAGMIRHHGAPNPYHLSWLMGAACAGVGEPPRERVRLDPTGLEAVVSEVVTAALSSSPAASAAAITRAVVKALTPRLTTLEAQNAMLTDTVVVAAALYFDQISKASERDYASEQLHLTASDLVAENPRLKNAYNPGTDK